MIFSVGGDDVGVFFPVVVTFNGQGCLAGVQLARAERVGGGEEEIAFSQDAVVSVDEYLVV